MKKTSELTKKPTVEEVVTEQPVKKRGPIAYSLILVIQTFVAFVGAQVIAPTLIAFAVLTGGVKSGDLLKFMDTFAMRFVLILAIEFLAVIGISYLVKRRQWTWKDIGINRKPNWHDLWQGSYIYAIYFAIFLAVYALERASGLINTEQAQQLGFNNAKGPVLILVFVSLVILPPIAEEIIFRGFLFKGLRKRLVYVKAALITSLLFGVAHLEFGNGGPLNWAAAIDTFTLSMILTYATERYKSIWPAMIAHSLKNAIAFVLLFLLK